MYNGESIGIAWRGINSGNGISLIVNNIINQRESAATKQCGSGEAMAASNQAASIMAIQWHKAEGVSASAIGVSAKAAAASNKHGIIELAYQWRGVSKAKRMAAK